MPRMLVAYATMAGSTAEVAQAIAEELRGLQIEVDLVSAADPVEVEAYEGVVLGGPMILGWHRAALRFLRRHRSAFQRIPVALFVTAMSLTKTEVADLDGVPLFVDEGLARPPASPDRLTMRERYAQVSNYLRPLLRQLRPARPVSIGIFAGRLEYGRLPWWAVVFAMGILRAPAGDRRNWPAIRAWAAGLPDAFDRSGS